MVQPRQLGLMQLEERFAQIISEEKQDSHSLSLSLLLSLSVSLARCEQRDTLSQCPWAAILLC